MNTILDASKQIQDAKYNLLLELFDHEPRTITVTLLDKTQLIDFVKFIVENNALYCDQLTDICGVDYLGRTKRFEVVYHFLSMKLNIRLRIKVPLDENHTIDSIISIIPCAQWYEREIYDMYGIMFYGHDNLKRILMGDDFNGHPLRKDFPLSGYTQVGYNVETQSVEEVPLNLNQDVRDFDFQTPWESVRSAVKKASSIDD